MVQLLGPPELQISLATNILRILPVGLLVVDSQQSVLVWNEWMESASGINEKDALGKPFASLFPNIKYGRFHLALMNALETGCPSVLSNVLNNGPLPLFFGSKNLMQQSIHIVPFLNSSNERCALIQVMDVSSARKREETIRKQAKVLDEVYKQQNALLHSIPDIAWLKDTQGRYLAVNDKFTSIFGVKPEAVHGKTDHQIHSGSVAERNEQTDRMVIETKSETRYDESIVTAEGRTIWVETVKVPILNQTEIIGIAGVSRDITERKATEERIHFLAHYDVLTELPNRFMLFERLDSLFARARRDGTQVAVFFVDLDRFKLINDTLGHTAGDILLQLVADRLKESSREVDIIARVGGDEFVIALTGIKESSHITSIAKKVLKTIGRPYMVNGHTLHVTPSLGVSIYPDDGEDTATLIKNADRAMYQVKKLGRNSYEFFNKEMDTLALDQLSLENGLRFALEREELELVYQSQVDLKTGAIVGAEAQLRWNHPELGLIMPHRFIGILEESGLIAPIGEWVIYTACQQNRKWQAQGLPPISIAVNLSSVQLQQKDFVGMLSRQLEKTGLQPEQLDLEITESVIMHNAEYTINVLQQLKDIGVRLSVDDFGTGYSSLSYLKRFPIDSLKIDRSFVRDLTSDTNDAAITSTIIAIAKQLNLTVIAEGVETLDQLNFLLSNGCDQIQGFYFSKPLSADDFAIHLKTGIHRAQFAAAAM
ncbi:MAG TPA: EAL domain-containing protein [Methylophilaceae bacterium]|nr:EAL domain-containing protein [Methylophilaceae bacterium]